MQCIPVHGYRRTCHKVIIDSFGIHRFCGLFSRFQSENTYIVPCISVNQLKTLHIHANISVSLRLQYCVKLFIGLFLFVWCTGYACLICFRLILGDIFHYLIHFFNHILTWFFESIWNLFVLLHVYSSNMRNDGVHAYFRFKKKRKWNWLSI